MIVPTRNLRLPGYPIPSCKPAVFLCPTLVLLDEPSMGLAPIIVQEIFEMKH